MIKILFPLIFSLLFAAIHALAYSRILKRLHVRPATRRALGFFLLFNFLGILGYLAARYFVGIPSLLYFLLSLSIGVGFALLIALILYELLHLLQHRLPLDQSKRDFFKRGSDLGFLGLGAFYVGAGVVEGSKTPQVLHVKVAQQRFAVPYKIAQISDMHIGGLVDKDFVAKSVALTNAQYPDLVVITGDLTDAPIAQLKAAVDELKALKNRFGTFYVVGNHEYFHGIEATIAYLQSIGITVLENENRLIDNTFYICGVHDVFGYRYGAFLPDITQAYQDVNDTMPTLLLAHQPRFLQYLEGFEPSLILSGHTHGGQIWPFGYLVRLQQPYLKGLHVTGSNRHIYVNSGIGFWGPPMRLGSSSEITIIEWS